MMFRLSILAQLMLMIAGFAFVSCSSDEIAPDQPVTPEQPDGQVPEAFMVNVNKYNTLQEAVHAAMKLEDGAVIKLTADTTGDGFQVKRNDAGSPDENFVEGKSFTIDFGGYDYKLNRGRFLEVCKSNVTITGMGGSLRNETWDNVLIVHGGDVTIKGKLYINGKMQLINTHNSSFSEGYEGTFTGDISTHEAEWFVDSDKAVLNVGSLHSESSFLHVVNAKSVNINFFATDTENPVKADNSASLNIHQGPDKINYVTR